MKRKIVNLLCIASMLSVCACGNEVLPVSTEAASETIVSTEISSTPELSQSFARYDEPGYILLDEGGIYCEFLQIMDEEGTQRYYAHILNNNDYYISFEINEMVVNGDIFVPGITIYADENEEIYSELQELYVEDISSIDMKISYTDKDSYDPIEKQVNIVITDGNTLQYIPAYDALAKEQVLIDNDTVRATLLGAGCNQAFGYGIYKDFSGIIRFENKSDEAIPLKINSACINGISFDNIVSNPDIMLPPSVETMLSFEINSSYIADNNITSIWNVSLQILTDESENTGYSSTGLEGGSWYDLELSSKGEVTDVDPGQLIYEDDSISVSCIGEEFIENASGTVRYIWTLKIDNKTDQDIALHRGVHTLNGEDIDRNNLDVFLYSVNCIRANGFTYTEMTYSGEPIDIEEVTSTFSISNSGKSKLLYESDTPIVINREQLGFLEKGNEDNEENGN